MSIGSGEPPRSNKPPDKGSNGTAVIKVKVLASPPLHLKISVDSSGAQSYAADCGKSRAAEGQNGLPGALLLSSTAIGATIRVRSLANDDSYGWDDFMRR